MNEICLGSSLFNTEVDPDIERWCKTRRINIAKIEEHLDDEDPDLIRLNYVIELTDEQHTEFLLRFS